MQVHPRLFVQPCASNACSSAAQAATPPCCQHLCSGVALTPRQDKAKNNAKNVGEGVPGICPSRRCTYPATQANKSGLLNKLGLLRPSRVSVAGGGDAHCRERKKSIPSEPAPHFAPSRHSRHYTRLQTPICTGAAASNPSKGGSRLHRENPAKVRVGRYE